MIGVSDSLFEARKQGTREAGSDLSEVGLTMQI
jgi:hypothetical protein